MRRPAEIDIASPSFPGGDAYIPTLEPFGLDRVPGWRPNDETWRNDYFQWREKVYQLQHDLDVFYRKNPSERAVELALCAEDPARWITLWCWLEEPRSIDNDGFEGVRPFTLFAGQVHVVDRYQQTLDDYIRDLYISKSRGWGASWLMCALFLHGWLFRKPFRAKMLSRKEELVDKPLDMDSLFAKIDFMMNRLVPWQVPPHKRQERMLKNLDNGNQIAGESTSSRSTRGGRATVVLYDEAAFMIDFANVYGTGAGTTNHRIAVSTESFEQGEDWFKAWTTQKVENPDWVIEADYFHNPSFSPEWAEAERNRLKDNPEMFEIEYMRNPYIGDRWIYPTARDLPAIPLRYDPTVMLVVGIDPGRADDTAIVWGQPIERGGSPGIAWLNSYERTHMMPEWYAHLLTGVDPEPGDPAYADWDAQGGWSENEQDIVNWTRTLPWSMDAVRYFMDPAGNQKHLDHETFQSRLFAESKRLRERLVLRGENRGQPATGIYAFWQEIKGKLNDHDTRRTLTRAYLPYMVFNDTRNGRRIRECLASSKFNEPSENATSQPAPVHDRFSHIRAAVEYVCVYASLGYTNRPKRREPKKGGR